MDFLNYLLEQGIISQNLFNMLEKNMDGFIDRIMEDEFVSKETLIKHIESFYEIEYKNPKTLMVKKEVYELVSDTMIKKYVILPFDMVDDIVQVLVPDPRNYLLDEDLDIILYPKKFKKYFAFDKEIEDKIYHIENIGDPSATLPDDYSAVGVVDKVIRSALSKGVSDIHIEPIEKIVRVRFRMDGDLVNQNEFTLPIGDYNTLVSRVKVLADMDPTIFREPQDGRIADYELDDNKYDLRISTMPTIYGEKIVMRVLEDKSQISSFKPLGFNDSEIDIIGKMLSKDIGILMITGETGSGKSTTLYAILNQMNTEDVNICTVENPVESSIPGVNQVQVNERAGITFASALRTFLRQDPDIIVVGETRDPETAKTSVDAANTGHFVLSTIHTNNTTTTINRLISMGVEPYKLADNIVGIISQKLVKTLCPHCRKPHPANAREIDFMKKVELRYGKPIITGNEVFYKAEGCSLCNKGYKGRTVLVEMLLVDDMINDLIALDLNSTELRKEVTKSDNFLPYEIQGIKKASEGIIDINDIIRMFS